MGCLGGVLQWVVRELGDANGGPSGKVGGWSSSNNLAQSSSRAGVVLLSWGAAAKAVGGALGGARVKVMLLGLLAWCEPYGGEKEERQKHACLFVLLYE